MTTIQKAILSVMALILAAMACTAVYLTVFWDPGTVRGEFVPPEFDPAAVSGTPAQVASHRGYGDLTLNQDTTVSMCANVYTENNAALVSLTAREGNTGWIKIKILDTDGTILGESGLLRPGEYVKSVALSRVPAAGTIVTVKILVYEPETYLSLGSATAQVRIAGPNNKAKTGLPRKSGFFSCASGNSAV